MGHKRSAIAQKTLGLKGKLLSKKRHAEKATMKKTIAMHEQRDNKHKAEDGAPQNALPAYLLERDQVCKTPRFRTCHHLASTCQTLRTHKPLLLIARSLVAGGQGKGSKQYHQAEAEAEGWKMGGSTPKGQSFAAYDCKPTCIQKLKQYISGSPFFDW